MIVDKLYNSKSTVTPYSPHAMNFYINEQLPQNDSLHSHLHLFVELIVSRHVMFPCLFRFHCCRISYTQFLSETNSCSYHRTKSANYYREAVHSNRIVEPHIFNSFMSITRENLRNNCNDTLIDTLSNYNERNFIVLCAAI